MWTSWTKCLSWRGGRPLATLWFGVGIWNSIAISLSRNACWMFTVASCKENIKKRISVICRALDPLKVMEAAAAVLHRPGDQNKYIWWTFQICRMASVERWCAGAVVLLRCFKQLCCCAVKQLCSCAVEYNWPAVMSAGKNCYSAGRPAPHPSQSILIHPTPAQARPEWIPPAKFNFANNIDLVLAVLKSFLII